MEHSSGTSLGVFATDLLNEGEEDLHVLERLCERVGADRFQAKDDGLAGR